MFVVQMLDWMDQSERGRGTPPPLQAAYSGTPTLLLSFLLRMIHFLGMWINSENRSIHAIHLLDESLKVETPQFLRVWQHDPWMTFMKSEQDACVSCSQDIESLL